MKPQLPPSPSKCIYCGGDARLFDMDAHGRKIEVDMGVLWCKNCRRTLSLKEVIYKRLRRVDNKFLRRKNNEKKKLGTKIC